MKSNMAAWALMLGAIFASAAAAQETKEVRIVQQFGLSYLPLHLAVEQKLIEKHARAAGLGDITVSCPSSAAAPPSTTRCSRAASTSRSAAPRC